MTAFLGLLFALLLVLPLQAQDTLILEALPEAGFYTSGVGVKVSCNRSQATIYYTLDGSVPSANSKRYRGDVLIDSSRTLRTVAYLNGQKSAVSTHTYLIKEDSITVPVFAISIQPSYLFDPVKGVFKRGPRASNRFPFKGANYYSRKEFPCYTEFFETNRDRVFHSRLGFKIFGGMSRIFPQKSFSLYASKSRHGSKYIRHQLYPEKDQKKYKRLILRNSGSDFGETHFRDALITSLGKDMGLEVQAYRPAVVFINGDYWGLYNMREKLTRHYIVENFGYHKDSINLVEHRKSTNAGSRKSYDAMRIFMRKNDLGIQKNFDYVASIMDVDNFMEYEIIQIYIDNQDAGGNIKFWQPKTAGGKWRWILYDTDFGLGHYGRYGYKNNSLEFHTKPNGPAWPNPPWSTLNLRSLLQNKSFKKAFVSRFLDRLNYTFDSTYILPRIDSFVAHIQPELPRHWKRWNLTSKRWQKEVDRMRDFVRLRPAFMRQFLQKKFPFVGEEVVLQVEADSNGQVLINDAIPVVISFEGVYFKNLPVVLEAKPYFGARFSHWEVDSERQDGRRLVLNFTDTSHQVQAVFVPGEHPAVQQFIINEISFGDTSAGDWLEFYNASDKSLDLTGWTVKSSGKASFIFPTFTLEPKQYLVLCKDKVRFAQAFPTCDYYLEGLPFNLSSKEDMVLIYDAIGDPVDSVSYTIDPALENAKTIVLGNFEEDNTLTSNWNPSNRAGSPASVNPDYIKQQEEKSWQQFLDYVKIGGITTAIFILIVLAYITARKQLRSK
ncbi:MAG: CotH kinase family protein [Aureispira sp.]